MTLMSTDLGRVYDSLDGVLQQSNWQGGGVDHGGDPHAEVRVWVCLLC